MLKAWRFWRSVASHGCPSPARPRRSVAASARGCARGNRCEPGACVVRRGERLQDATNRGPPLRLLPNRKIQQHADHREQQHDQGPEQLPRPRHRTNEELVASFR
jgi:hypothetical protein